MLKTILTITAAFILSPTIADESHAKPERKPLVIFCVRHAEKVDASRDPALTPAGNTRARLLARTLIDARISAIHSSDYQRTRDTAAPLADKLNLKTQIYDPRALPDLVQLLKQKGGRHLVVGHSNTTPELVRLLGGMPGKAIVEATEFDRLYVVTIPANGTVQTVLLRYGKSGSPSNE